jgi:flagellar FliL protein
MAVADSAADPPKRRRLLPAILGLVLAVALGAGGFYAAYSGLLPTGSDTGEAHDAAGDDHGAAVGAMPPVAFVPIDPMVISLSGSERVRHLRFQAQLEVAAGQEGNVAALMPRILDVLNGYLRAVTIEDLERPTALLTLRAQMLRRVQLVVGDGRVNDLLVTEFVLN